MAKSTPTRAPKEAAPLMDWSPHLVEHSKENFKKLVAEEKQKFVDAVNKKHDISAEIDPKTGVVELDNFYYKLFNELKAEGVLGKDTHKEGLTGPKAREHYLKAAPSKTPKARRNKAKRETIIRSKTEIGILKAELSAEQMRDFEVALAGVLRISGNPTYLDTALNEINAFIADFEGSNEGLSPDVEKEIARRYLIDQLININFYQHGIYPYIDSRGRVQLHFSKLAKKNGMDVVWKGFKMKDSGLSKEDIQYHLAFQTSQYGGGSEKFYNSITGSKGLLHPDKVAESADALLQNGAGKSLVLSGLANRGRIEDVIDPAILVKVNKDWDTIRRHATIEKPDGTREVKIRGVGSVQLPQLDDRKWYEKLTALALNPISEGTKQYGARGTLAGILISVAYVVGSWKLGKKYMKSGFLGLTALLGGGLLGGPFIKEWVKNFRNEQDAGIDWFGGNPDSEKNKFMKQFDHIRNKTDINNLERFFLLRNVNPKFRDIMTKDHRLILKLDPSNAESFKDLGYGELTAEEMKALMVPVKYVQNENKKMLAKGWVLSTPPGSEGKNLSLGNFLGKGLYHPDGARGYTNPTSGPATRGSRDVAKPSGGSSSGGMPYVKPGSGSGGPVTPKKKP